VGFLPFPALERNFDHHALLFPLQFMAGLGVPFGVPMRFGCGGGVTLIFLPLVLLLAS
jgi:hypothetical protein